MTDLNDALEHPLTEADLATEVDYLRDKDRKLVVATS